MGERYYLRSITVLLIVLVAFEGFQLLMAEPAAVPVVLVLWVVVGAWFLSELFTSSTWE